MVFVSIFGLISVVFLGYLAVNLFLEKESFVEKTALGFILGYGLFSFFLFLAALKGVQFRLLESSFILAISILVFLILNKIFKRQICPNFYFKTVLSNLKSGFISLPSPAKTALIWIIFIFLSIFIYDLYWPLRGFDAFVMYDFRAKIFAATGNMNDAIARGYFIAYPLMTSLSHTWLYLIGYGSPMFLYALFYISLIILFYFTLRKILNSKIAIILTAVFCSFPDFYSQAQVAYTNLPYFTYLVLGSIYLYLGIKSDKKGFLVISMILTALSGWTRTTEPFWLVNVIVILFYGLYKIRKLPMALGYSFFVYIFRIPWNKFYELNTKAVLNTSSQIQGSVVSLTKAVSEKVNFGPVLGYFYAYTVKPYVVLYVLLFALIILKIVRKSNNWWFTLILMGDFLLLFLGTCVFSLNFPEWINIPGSFKRMVIFLIPMIIYFVADCLGEYNDYSNVYMKKANKKVKLS